MWRDLVCFTKNQREENFKNDLESLEVIKRDERPSKEPITPVNHAKYNGDNSLIWIEKNKQKIQIVKQAWEAINSSYSSNHDWYSLFWVWYL